MFATATVGEFGTISAAIGTILNYLARHPEVQDLLRADSSLTDATTDEILHNPIYPAAGYSAFFIRFAA